MLAYGKLSRDLMSEGKSGGYIGLEFSGKVLNRICFLLCWRWQTVELQLRGCSA